MPNVLLPGWDIPLAHMQLARCELLQMHQHIMAS